MLVLVTYFNSTWTLRSLQVCLPFFKVVVRITFEVFSYRNITLFILYLWWSDIVVLSLYGLGLSFMGINNTVTVSVSKLEEFDIFTGR